jgi:glucosamine-6-phosphate deaminase
MAAETVICVVPGTRKAEAVHHALIGPIAPDCPASILRTHPNATLYLDAESAARLPRRDLTESSGEAPG